MVVVPDTFEDVNSISLQSLNQYPFISSEPGVDEDVMSVLQEENIDVNVQFYCREDSSILAMVKQGLGISLLPQLIVDGQDIRALPLKEKKTRTLGIGINDSNRLSPASRAFIEMIQKEME